MQSLIRSEQGRHEELTSVNVGGTHVKQMVWLSQVAHEPPVLLEQLRQPVPRGLRKYPELHIAQ